MATPVEQIKERLSIVEVVSSYVQLHKAGKHYKGKSPFTNEKTPSFFVSPDRGMYYCFSSGKGGDMFTFVQEMEGLDFKGALALLAERAQVELVPEDPKKRTERETTYAVLEAATAYYMQMLAGRADIQAYLAKRGVQPHTSAKWRIGFVPEGWRNLSDHLTQKGFTEVQIARAGLIKQSEERKTYYDVFRDRIMFPIADASGRVVAFSGRAMSSDPAMPKYVNSPETELYEKSHILFGYDKAKQSIRSHDFSLIVEGQFDLVLAHQAGFTNTVAISGTALSEHHTALLERLSRRVVLALDADKAGVGSVKRAAHIMLARGMDVKVARLPDGKDPADLVAEDPALLKQAVRNAQTVIEFLIAVLRNSTRDDRAFKLRVRDEVLPFILRIPNRIDREHFESVVSEALNTTKDAVHFEVERMVQATPSSDADLSRTTTPSRSPETVKKEVDRIGERARFLYGVILWQEAEQSMALDTKEIRGALKEALGEEAWQAINDLSEEEKNKHIFEAEAHCAGLALPALLAEVHDFIQQIQKQTLEQAHKAARAQLRAAEASGDQAAIEAALEECAALQKRIGALGASASEH